MAKEKLFEINAFDNIVRGSNFYLRLEPTSRDDNYNGPNRGKLISVFVPPERPTTPQNIRVKVVNENYMAVKWDLVEGYTAYDIRHDVNSALDNATGAIIL